MSALPGVLAEIETAAGTAAALKLARARGGSVIKISDHPRSVLHGIVGAEAAQAIVAALGRIEVLIPMATARGQRGRQAAALELAVKGASALQIAMACDVHTRTAWRAKAHARDVSKDAPNRDLFEED